MKNFRETLAGAHSFGQPSTIAQRTARPLGYPVGCRVVLVDNKPTGVRLRGLVERFQYLVHELGKFGIVGIIAYIVDTGILRALLAVDVNPLLAKTISTVVSATVAFLGNRYWTWRHRARSGLHREYTLYFMFNVVGLAIGLACLGISHYALGRYWPVLRTDLADVVSANVVGMFFGTIFRFWSYRKFVFRPADPGAPLPYASATAHMREPEVK